MLNGLPTWSNWQTIWSGLTEWTSYHGYTRPSLILHVLVAYSCFSPLRAENQVVCLAPARYFRRIFVGRSFVSALLCWRSFVRRFFVTALFCYGALLLRRSFVTALFCYGAVQHAVFHLQVISVYYDTAFEMRHAGIHMDVSTTYYIFLKTYLRRCC